MFSLTERLDNTGIGTMRRHVGLLLVLVATAAAEEGEVRNWTNKEGRTMQAEFLREVDGDVTFLKDGKLLTLSLDQLSEDDQRFIRNAEATKKVEETAPPAGAPRPVEISPIPLDTAASDAKSSLTKQKVVIEERTWRDLRGKPQVGKFVRMHQGSVVISSGSRALRVPYYTLSQPDREYLRELLAARGESTQLPPEMPAGQATDFASDNSPGGQTPPISALQPPPESTPVTEGNTPPSTTSELAENRVANRPIPGPPSAKPAELVPHAESRPKSDEHVSYTRPVNPRFGSWNLTRPQPDENGVTRPNISIVPLLIGFPIVLLIGSLIGAFVLRGGAYFVLREHVEFGTAFMTMLVANLINMIVGFLVGAGYGVATGSGEGKEVLSLLMLPVGFLIQSGIISNSLETDYGAACLVSLVMYVIWFVVILVLVGIGLCFIPLAAHGFVG
jgi:hypothetical protein